MRRTAKVSLRDAEPIGPLVLFELRRSAQRPATPVALLILALTLAIGHADHWRGGSATITEGFFIHAYLIGAIVLMRYGLAADRRLRFDEYLIVNHVGAATYVAAKVCAMAVLLLAYGGVAAVLETAYSGGALGAALWAAAALTLTAWLFAPVVMLVEAWLDTSVPAAVVLLAFVVAVLVSFFSARSLLPLDAIGVTEAAPGYWSTLAPLALRALVAAPIGFVLVGSLARLNLPRC